MTRKKVQMVLASVVLVGCCVAIRYYSGAAPASADTVEQAAGDDNAAATSSDLPAAPAPRERFASRSAARTSTSEKYPNDPARKTSDTARTRNGQGSIPEMVAAVNNQRITREELGKECLRHFGNEVLESMVNKQLISGECRRRGITVTEAEVSAEIEQMSKRFNIPVDQWLKMLKQERNVTPAQYANDIIWPTLALRKLAGSRLTITREELQNEYETQYGPMVRARLISVHSADKAKQLHAEAVAHANESSHFGNLAKTASEDAASASLKGMINPIRMHGSYKEIEDAAFGMADGQISDVIYAGGQYVILKREGMIPPQRVSFEQVQPRLVEVLRDRKMHGVSKDIFAQLQKEAEGRIQWVWMDPEKRRKMPGVAAVVLDSPITVRELTEECLARHAPATLESLISRKILEQACRRQGVTVTEAEIDAEIAEAAATGFKPKADGTPDVQGWLELVTKKQHIPLEAYRHDVVWPIAALKKLVHGKVQVTEEDLRKGFEANFGPRVRCLAIVLDTQRRAQQVFDLARKHNNSDYFGDLAAQYSVEPGSQSLRGEIPPIKKYGGQPQIEDEAFALKPGDLSGIIQVGDKFVILRCEGYTEPVVEEFAKVRDDIYRDLHEKKLQQAMGDKFNSIQEAAVVDNYLTGSTHSPRPSAKAGPGVSQLKQIPGDGS
ncbi:MAG: peptidyl-prolyl cis-trans isomerase [Planctomycetaceae bacterium]|nr:peptidyl-prolyl cis-trans isomerase [Planctomycetaceae bacterium]